MYIGQNCLVQWDNPDDKKSYVWHDAIIKSIHRTNKTVTVIWKEGKEKGYETENIPMKWILPLDDCRKDISDLHAKVDKMVLCLNTMVDKLNTLNSYFLSAESLDTTMEEVRNSLSSVDFSSDVCDVFAVKNKSEYRL